jgi:tRNA threonylcarbamoyladenosine biosynthesis protein TsaB
MIKKLMAQAQVSLKQLDAIAYGRGPGSFAGTRIATGTAQGLAFGIDCPVITVSALQAMALRCSKLAAADYYLCALNASMGELYWGQYQKKNSQKNCMCGNERIYTLENLSSIKIPSELSYIVCGDVWKLDQKIPIELIQNAISVEPQVAPRAHEIVLIGHSKWLKGEVLKPENALPTYLRNDSQWKKLPRFRKNNQ